MRGTKLICLSLISFVTSALVTFSARAAQSPVPTADQIVERNIAARGGLKAWREIQAMTLNGKMDAGSSKNAQLPFVMKLKRPQMSRLEITLGGKTAVQVYDGENGWKVRPFLGRNEVEPYTAEEKQMAAQESGLDGWLIDHDAKGIKVELAGGDTVEGKDAYKLTLTLKNGTVRHLWVDAQSFLELKVEGTPRKLDGRMHNVEVYYRNYSSIAGLMIPFVLETVVEKVQPSRKITIESVLLNPKMDDSTFAKPVINDMAPQQNAPRPQSGAEK